MRRSSTSGLRRFGAFVLLTAVTSMSAVASPVFAQEPEDSPPTINGTTISPAGVPYTGGTVTITVEATDDVGVESVYADVRDFFGGGTTVELLATGPNTYSGTVDVGPNYTDTPVSYGVGVTVTDTSGATTWEEFAGNIDVDAQPQFDEPPSAYAPAVSPRELPAAGGEVTLAFSAWDLRGITWASATVTLPNGETTEVTTEPISSDRFEGTFTAPPNTGSTPQTYSIEFTAYDDIGQWDALDGGTVTVAPSLCKPHRGKRKKPWPSNRPAVGHGAGMCTAFPARM
jgi:hypothetical protein